MKNNNTLQEPINYPLRTASKELDGVAGLFQVGGEAVAQVQYRGTLVGAGLGATNLFRKYPGAGKEREDVDSGGELGGR